MLEKIKRNGADWASAAAIRALKTFGQTSAAALTVNLATPADISWAQVVSVGIVGAVYSLLTSLGGLPEVEEPPAR